MNTAVILDCEFLCIEGSLRRLWSGPQDPDPLVVQIGAVKLGLEGAFPILETLKLYVRPVDRFGRRCGLDPYFTRLTGVTEEDIETSGVDLGAALAALDRFSLGAGFWSWGKDEMLMVAISGYIAGLAPPIPAHRFGNATGLLLAADMPLEALEKTRSSELADHFGIAHPALKAHDALDDALSLGYTLQHLLRTGRLGAEAFAR